MGLLSKKANQKKVDNFEFVDFKYSFFFDCGAPVFKTEDGQYAFAPNLEAFKQCFARMSSNYLQSVNVDTFKDLFKDIKDHYNYPDKDAEKVKDECVNKINAAKMVEKVKTSSVQI